MAAFQRIVGACALALFALACHDVQVTPMAKPGEIGIYDDLFSVAVVNDKMIIAVGYYGAIYRSRDAGATWEKRDSGTLKSLYGVSMADEKRGWAVGQGGIILRTQDGGARGEKGAPPAVGVEPDHVVREQPFVDGYAQLLRQRVPVVRLRPRDVHEVGGDHLRSSCADDARREVQVVVVEEDGRLRLPLELLERRCREPLVDGHVALPPCLVQRRIEVGTATEPPEVVVQEHERRVRDRVVEAVVGHRVMGDEPQPVRRALPRSLLERMR